MPNPDGWSQNPNGTWSPPVHAAVQKQWEVPPDVSLTIIRDKAIEVIDNNGVVRVRIGKDGDDFDVKLFDVDGTEVKLSTLAFGLAADDVVSTESTNSSPFTDLATPGPEVTVEIGPSGRALVTIMTVVTVDNDGVGEGQAAQAMMGFDVVREGVVVRLADATRSAHSTLSLATGTSGVIVFWEGTISRAVPFDDLEPGTYTFTAKYRTNGTTCNFTHRSIVVQPF